MNPKETEALKEVISALIDKGKEGVYWDFKELPHQDVISFVHDIICLANTPDYTGDRYLIYGVQDKTFNVVGIDKNTINQADLIDKLANSNFAGGNYPSIELKLLQIGDKQIAVIIIEDLPRYRPYYLEKDKCEKKQKNENSNSKSIRAGTIYSRTQDRNTAISNAVASTASIEKMWRQRFGLDTPILKRMEKYLLDYNNWTRIKEGDYCYYTLFPEFIVERSPHERQEVSAHESWVRSALDPTSLMFNIELRYHQTVLYTEELLGYDYSTTYFPVPYNTHELKKFGDGNVFYYYLEKELKFSLLQFYQEKDLYSRSRLSGGRTYPPLVIFKDQEELKEFTNYLERNFTERDINKIGVLDKFSSSSKEIDIQRIKLCKLAMENLPKWREKQET